jgi:hypothetical protein
MRQFSIGEVVTCIPDMFLRHAAPGDYKIVAAMPDRDGDHIYRIKSPLEEHERVVKESLLVKSHGFLPEDALRKSSRPSSITLPTLRADMEKVRNRKRRGHTVLRYITVRMFMSAQDSLNKQGQSVAVLRSAILKPTRWGISIAVGLLFALPLAINAADAGGGRGGGVSGGFGGHIGVGGAGFGGRGVGAGFPGRPIVGARSGNTGIGGPPRPARFTGPSFGAPRAGASRGVFGNRAIANAALQPRFGFARFQGRFFGSPWPWWWGGLAIGWIGPVFWPYVYYDFFDYVFWPYAYDDFWPYAYDDIYYGIYGPYAYAGPVVQIAAAPGASVPARNVSTAGVARAEGSEQRVAEVCNNNASDLTDLPIERISEAVQPTEAQRPALDELRTASATAISILKAGCPKDLPSTPTGRLAAMENRVQMMLQAVQTMRPPLEHFYQQLSDEQKARFDALSPGGESIARQDQRNLTKLCQDRAPGLTDLPFDRIAKATQPTPPQRPSFDELKDASVKAAERLKVNCPSDQAVTATGRVAAMEKRLAATHDAVTTVQPALVKFYDGLNDEQKARFNSLRSAPGGSSPAAAGPVRNDYDASRSPASERRKITDDQVVAPPQRLEEE